MDDMGGERDKGVRALTIRGRREEGVLDAPPGLSGLFQEEAQRHGKSAGVKG